MLQIIVTTQPIWGKPSKEVINESTESWPIPHQFAIGFLGLKHINVCIEHTNNIAATIGEGKSKDTFTLFASTSTLGNKQSLKQLVLLPLKNGDGPGFVQIESPNLFDRLLGSLSKFSHGFLKLNTPSIRVDFSTI